MKPSSTLKNKRPKIDSTPNYDFCGTCSEALDCPKIPLNSYPHLSTSIISCANWKKKCCKALTHGPTSPHHHLGCVCRMIPIDSAVYKNIIHYAELQYSEVESDKMKIDTKCVDIVKTTVNKQDTNTSSVESVTSHGSRHSVGASTTSGRKSSSKIINPFLCDYCNVQGSAQYLFEYFSNFRKFKTQYYDDDEAVDSIPPVGNVGDSDSENISDELLTKDQGFIQHILNQHGYDASENQTEVSLENIRRILKNISSGSSSFSLEKCSVTPYCLLGQPLRLYCSITRSYHCGRIIDSRTIDSSFHQRLKPQSKLIVTSRLNKTSDSSIQDGTFLDQSIGCTQYLVRFRAGVDGRKVAIHQWLFLEEHSIMVGVATVWVKTPKSILVQDFDDANNRYEQSQNPHKMKSIFSPAKIFACTVIELCRSRELEASNCSKDAVLVAFYDREDKNIRLVFTKELKSDSCTEILGTKSNSEQIRKESILYESFDEVIAADFNDPSEKLKLYLQTMRARDESLVEKIAAALVDEEEKLRIIEDHAMM